MDPTAELETGSESGSNAVPEHPMGCRAVPDLVAAEQCTWQSELVLARVLVGACRYPAATAR